MSDDQARVPWLQMDGEPDVWYHRFWTYYVGMGLARSLRMAYKTYLKTEEPEKYEGKVIHTASPEWASRSNEFNWRKRAQAYDRELMGQSQLVVQQAKQDIQSSANAAVQALIQALQEPRNKVSAAKAILDRAGLPAQAELTLTTKPYTSDDFNKAYEELEQWEQDMEALPEKIDSNG